MTGSSYYAGVPRREIHDANGAARVLEFQCASWLPWTDQRRDSAISGLAVGQAQCDNGSP